MEKSVIGCGIFDSGGDGICCRDFCGSSGLEISGGGAGQASGDAGRVGRS